MLKECYKNNLCNACHDAGCALSRGVEDALQDAQAIKRACMVCCPMCDEKKCVGRYNCEEIKKYIEEHKKEGLQ